MSVGGDPFEVEEVEIRGVRLKVFAHAPASPRSVWDGSASHSDKPYLVCARTLGAPPTDTPPADALPT